MDTSFLFKDILELVLLCMVIFLPLGFIVGRKFYKFKIIYRFGRRFRVGIKDEGSFSRFISKE